MLDCSVSGTVMLHSGNYVTEMVFCNPSQPPQCHACAMQFEKLNLKVGHVSTHRQHADTLFLLRLHWVSIQVGYFYKSFSQS